MKDDAPEVDMHNKFAEIKDMGFVKSLRRGDTGIGFTFETLFGIKENNRKGHDFTYNGKRIEAKSRRRHTTANMTLFTKEPSIRELHDVELMKKYGYLDIKKRLALKPDCKFGQFNAQNLGLDIDKKTNSIQLIDSVNNTPWVWTSEDISFKLENLLFVIADSKGTRENEFFHYRNAIFYEDFIPTKFLELIENKKIVINLRMHQNPTGGSRNRGTGFRLTDVTELDKCYKKMTRLN